MESEDMAVIYMRSPVFLMTLNYESNESNELSFKITINEDTSGCNAMARSSSPSLIDL
jgi:hypothetical protein